MLKVHTGLALSDFSVKSKSYCTFVALPFDYEAFEQIAWSAVIYTNCICISEA